MNIDDGLALISEVVFLKLGRHLSQVETLVITGAWQGQTYDQIASESHYAPNYLKIHVGPALWKNLSEAFAEPVTKLNLRLVLERHWRALRSLDPPLSTPIERTHGLSDQPQPRTITPHTDRTCQSDWRDAPNIANFYGRQQELGNLIQWVSVEHCRLIALLGMGGIGKTVLAVKLAQQVSDRHPSSAFNTALSPISAAHHPDQEPFEFVVWRSLRNAPPFNTLVQDLISFLSQPGEFPLDLPGLMSCLQFHRCLIILDNFETLLQGGELAGQLHNDYVAYGELIRWVCETQHRSCLLLTSREKPFVMIAYEGESTPVRSLHLIGSTEIAQELLQAQLLSGTPDQQGQLCDRYSNNPLALKIVATSIHDLFDSQIGDFLREDTFIFNGIRRLLDQQFQRLSSLEQMIMYWLAINREWTRVSELQEDIVPSVSKSRLFEALESLSWRSLVEKKAGRYTQQPVVMEYITEQLIGRIHRELMAQSLVLFHQVAILKTTVKDYIRKTQEQLLVGAIAKQLAQDFGAPLALEFHLKSLLTHLRNRQEPPYSYGPGNLLNLCIHLQVDLQGYDFSALELIHAHLQEIELHQVNFAQAVFGKCSFTETFGNILAIAFSPNGQLIATGDANNQVCLWRLDDGQLLQSFRGHTDWVRAVQFSPDGSRLISGSDDQSIRFWDIDSGRCSKLLSEPLSRAASLDLSPDGRTLVSSGEHGEVYLWDIDRDACRRTLSGHRLQIWSVEFSPDGQRMVSSSEDCTLRLWDASTGDCLQVITGHQSCVQSATFSPDGYILASGSHDHTIKLWQVESGDCLNTLTGHRDWVWCVTFSPDGNLLASASEDQTIRLWDLATGHRPKILNGHKNRIWTLAFSPDGTILASGSDDQTLKLWDVHTGQCIKTLQGHSRKIFPVAYSPDGQILASSGDEPIIRFWDLPQSNYRQSSERCHSRIESLAFSPDGRTLASGGEDKILRLWDVETQTCRHRLTGHPRQIWTVAYSPEGRTLASSGEDGTIWFWDSQSGDCLRRIEAHQNWVLTIAFNADGSLLASASFDQTLKLWKTDTGTLINTFRGHSNSVTGVIFDPTGQWLASSSFDRTVKLWDLTTGTCFKSLEGHEDAIIPLAYSPQKSLIASGSFDRTIKLWHYPTGKCIQTLTGHTDPIYSLSFHPEGRVLASGSWDETIRIWDLQTGTCVQTLRSDRPYEGMNITGVTGLSEAQKATLINLGAVHLKHLPEFNSGKRF